MTDLTACCLTRDQVNAWIEKHHRHHGRVSGHRFIVGALLAGALVGVAVAGRPRARAIQQYENLEVSRLCSDGSPNVCSFLYSRCGRVARELGFRTCFTSILESESGASLRAAGWLYVYTTRGGSQDRPSRRRVDKSPTEPKQVWSAHWCLDAARALNAERARVAQARPLASICASSEKRFRCELAAGHKGAHRANCGKLEEYQWPNKSDEEVIA